MSHCVVKFRGAHIQHGYLKAGIAVFPSEEDKSYAVQYVPKPVIPKGGYPGAVDERGFPRDGDDFRAWLSSLPTRMELNPAFIHFIRINPDTTLPRLEAEVERTLTPDVLTSADAFLSDRATERRSFSRFRKLMQPRERLGNGLVLPRGYDAALVAEATERFKGLFGELDGKGRIMNIEPGTIDIGAPAIDRASGASAGLTFISKNNPANDSGSITSVHIYAVAGWDLANCEVATFEEVATNTFTSRDSEVIGSVPGGSVQTFSGLNMDVSEGDYIGLYYSAGKIENDPSGFGGMYYLSGDRIPCTSAVFSLLDGDAPSLYGEGGGAVTEKESSDTGSGIDAVESLETPQAKTSSDAGSGLEAIIARLLTDDESGSAIEALISRLLADGESGAAVEAADVGDEGQLKDISTSEPAEGADRLVAKIEIPAKGGGMRLWI